uniref:Uncharacterized protein n=1 Tax=Xiphophorus couchianus TaxID=32473 RepID=A0A3B5MHN7_9TELE
MENPEKGGRRNPLATASLFSKLFLCWLTPLMRRGRKQRLNENDMYDVLPEDRSENLGEDLQRIWTQEVRSARKELRDPKLTRVLAKAYGKSYALAGLYVFSLVCSGSYLYFINN